MKPIQLRHNVYWVGGIDWDLRNFHGYLTQKGSTYNAYLIIDDKITLIDTVKSNHYEEMLERISAIISPDEIDYIVSNHVEMDHSGGLPKLMELLPNAEIIVSPKGEEGLREHYKKDWKFRIIDDINEFNTGNFNLKFIPTPMVHWPDNMVTYLEEEKILFSNDAFGQHIATSERFDDEYLLDIITEQARKYYANIVLPYSAQVEKVLQVLEDIDIEMIAPSHGIIWRSNVDHIISHYKKWAGNNTKKKALVIYDTMWKSTELMANEIASVFISRGYEVRLLNLQANHISDIMTEIIEAEYICVGSPTLNNNMLPTVSAFLTYMKGLAPRNRKALAFGSYGWGGQGVKQVHEILSGCKYEMLDPFKIKYIPSSDQISEMKNKLISEIEKIN